MNTSQTSSHGCGGGGTCGCGSKSASATQQGTQNAYPSIDTAAPVGAAAFAQTRSVSAPETIASINGITLHAAGKRPDEE